MCIRDKDNPERRLRVASRIINSAQRMERLIADLLDLANARLGGSLPLKRQLTDLQQVCEEAIVEVRAAHPDTTLRSQMTGDLHGQWDADRLAQVVSNLLANAVQHGGGTAITLTAQAQGDAVTLAVQNGGPPIPKHALPSIFEPLARGAMEPSSHSIGLGLFIARAVVTAHGGDIQVSSSTEAGTTFTVRLPKT